MLPPDRQEFASTQVLNWIMKTEICLSLTGKLGEQCLQDQQMIGASDFQPPMATVPSEMQRFVATIRMHGGMHLECRCPAVPEDMTILHDILTGQGHKHGYGTSAAESSTVIANYYHTVQPTTLSSSSPAANFQPYTTYFCQASQMYALNLTF